MKRTKSKRSLSLLIAVVLFSTLSSSIAAVFCPHMSGGSDCASMKTFDAHPHEHIGADTPHDMSTMHHPSLQTTSNGQSKFEAITQEEAPCGHCMMHSQPRSATLFSVVLRNEGSQRLIPVEHSPEIIFSSESRFFLFDLHEHGPPGFPGSRYLLINVFRI